MAFQAIHPDFDRAVLRGSLIGEVLFMINEDAPTHVIVSWSYWRFRKSDGSPDLRYKPDTQLWPLGAFARMLQTAVDLGDLEEWSKLPAAELKPFDHIADLLRSPKNKLRRGEFFLDDGEVYWDQCSHVPLFPMRRFDAFVDAARLLAEIAQRLG